MRNTTSSDNPTLHERLSNKNIITKLSVGTAITLGALGLAGCSQETHASAPTPSATSELVPLDTYKPLVDQANCPTLEDGPDSAKNYAPVSVVECRDFTKLTPEQQQIVLQGEQLSVEEFRKLPENEQQMFGNFVLSNWAGQAQYEANSIMKANGGDGTWVVKDFKETFSPKDNNDPSSIDRLTTELAVLTSLRYTDASGQVHYDKATAQKLLSVIAVPGSPAWKTLESKLDAVESNTQVLDIANGNVIILSSTGESVSDRTVTIGKTKDVPEYTINYSQDGTAKKSDTFGDLHLGFDGHLTVAVNPSVTIKGTPTHDVLLSNIAEGQVN